MREIASPLSLQVLQRRKQMGDLHQMPGDCSYGRLRAVKGYRQFIADPDMGGDEAQPGISTPRASTLDLSLSPLMPFVNAKER